MNKKRTVYIASAALLLAAAVIILKYTAAAPRPAALLHSPGDTGYIEYEHAFPETVLSSPQAFVYDAQADKIILLKGEESVVYPASTTKLATALFALTVLERDVLVTPGDELSLLSPASSIAYIKPWHTLSVEMLVEAMLIPSGNDAAYALAAAAGQRLGGASGISAVDVFMDAMNTYAASIGLCGTHFTVPDGLDGTRHFTTLEDMVIISKLAYENELISKYAAMPSDEVVYASGHINTWKNTNLMLDPESGFYSPYVTGLKTGSANGEYCLIAVIKNGNKAYIAGVFGAESDGERYEDMLKITDALFKNHSSAT